MEDIFLKYKSNFLEIRIMSSELENTLSGFNSGLDRKMTDLEDIAVKVGQNEKHEMTKKKYIEY